MGNNDHELHLVSNRESKYIVIKANNETNFHKGHHASILDKLIAWQVALQVVLGIPYDESNLAYLHEWEKRVKLHYEDMKCRGIAKSKLDESYVAIRSHAPAPNVTEDVSQRKNSLGVSVLSMKKATRIRKKIAKKIKKCTNCGYATKKSRRKYCKFCDSSTWQKINSERVDRDYITLDFPKLENEKKRKLETKVVISAHILPIDVYLDLDRTKCLIQYFSPVLNLPWNEAPTEDCLY